MAKATQNATTPKPIVTGYTLELTENEATALVGVLEMVGGPMGLHRKWSARALTRSVLDSLTTAGAESDTSRPGFRLDAVDGGLYFEAVDRSEAVQ